MHLIELFLPLYDNEGRAFTRAEFDRVRRELTERFGGVTAFTRVPAEGVWREDGGAVTRDEIIILEVMVDELDRDWWAQYREDLRQWFRQEKLLLRATATTLL
jgi:hypothetical protein